MTALITAAEAIEAHVFFMQEALTQANKAYLLGEVPVGAVVVHNSKIIGVGFNQPIAKHDPSAHAEMQALRMAGQVMQNYRLPDCQLFVTLEPCLMCAGAIQHARLSHLVYGAADYKTGACGSVLDVFAIPALNHHTRVIGGVLAEHCSKQLSQFFAERRAAHRAKKRSEAIQMPLPVLSLGNTPC